MCLCHGILKDLINFPVRYGSKTLWKFLTIFYQYWLKRWMWTCNRLTVDPLIIIKYAICYIIVWIYFNHCRLTFISNSSVFLNSFLTYNYFYLKFDLCPRVLILYSLFYILSANLARNVPMLRKGMWMIMSKYQTFSWLFNGFGALLRVKYQIVNKVRKTSNISDKGWSWKIFWGECMHVHECI